jgi:hypothetical protein
LYVNDPVWRDKNKDLIYKYGDVLAC